MYLKHYNLEQLPFRNTPDPRFFFATDKHNEALANLIYAVEQRRGFVMLTGEIGSGKTLVTHLLLQQVESHALVALVRNTHLNSAQLIRLICDEFAVQVGHHDDKASMLLNLNQFLIQQLAEDRLVVIIIDEAQNLSDRVLEELRMLSNLETSTDKLIQIVMVGQPELRDKVSQPQLEQLRTRIALSYHLEPLTPEEVREYIEHRLRVAGPEHRVVMTDEAVEKIAKFSRGTPRVINGLCDNALLYGFTGQTHTIDEALIDKVIRQSMHMAPRQRVGPIRQATYTRPAGPARRASAEAPAARPRRSPEPDAGREGGREPEAAREEASAPPPLRLATGATALPARQDAPEEAIGPIGHIGPREEPDAAKKADGGERERSGEKTASGDEGAGRGADVRPRAEEEVVSRSDARRDALEEPRQVEMTPVEGAVDAVADAGGPEVAEPAKDAGPERSAPEGGWSRPEGAEGGAAAVTVGEAERPVAESQPIADAPEATSEPAAAASSGGTADDGVTALPRVRPQRSSVVLCIPAESLFGLASVEE